MKMKHTEKHTNSTHIFYLREKPSGSASVSFQVILPCKITSGFVACCTYRLIRADNSRMGDLVIHFTSSIRCRKGKKAVLNRVHVNNDAGKMWYFTWMSSVVSSSMLIFFNELRVHPLEERWMYIVNWTKERECKVCK